MRMTFRLVALGGLIVFLAVVAAVVFVPGVIWNPPQTIIAHSYTSEQERGRIVFYSNGCNYCHTQYVREDDTAMGPVSQGGNYIFDNPMILGSERTGPDLSYIGRKRSEAWEIDHWKNPRGLSPLSLMPSFEFLPESDLQAMSAYLFALGDRVAAERMIRPPDPYTNISSPITYPVSTPPPSDKVQGWATWEAAGLQEGKELYVTYCLTCHGCAGNGLGSYAGTLIVTPADFGQEPFRRMPDDQWFWHVSEGVQGTVMPPWKASLDPYQRWHVIRYIQQIFSLPIMRASDVGQPTGEYAGLTNPVQPTIPVVEEGKTIFTRECLVCHGPAGRGHGPYREGLQPPPPDFHANPYGVPEAPLVTDAEYFWYISEGLPWTAMPAWKLQYSAEDRWKLVHYIRINFTQTEERPQTGTPPSYPSIYMGQPLPKRVSEADIIEGDLSQVAPQTPSLERGRERYLESCAHCHGLTGLGDGWDGQYLEPKPIPLRSSDMGQLSPGLMFSMISFGVPASAMPVWGEFLPESDRWDTVKYVTDAFFQGLPSQPSVYQGGATGANVLTLSQEYWTRQGHVISTTHGADLYATYCATCHGDKGQGEGPGVTNLSSGGPAPFPANMSLSYIYWRVWDGVPESIMYRFQWFFTEADVWDVSFYVETLVGTQGGGQ